MDARGSALPDDGGERAAVFVATLVPAGGTVYDVEARVVQEIRTRCTAPPPEGAGGYVWHREAPVVAPSDDPADPSGTVRIQMRVQDSVEDEWFMTYILRTLTQSAPGLCVRVEDEDGEFLLIEAAHELPKWVRPENAMNRVWICDGELHLIPLEYTTDAPHDDEHESYLSVADAVQLVRNTQVPTQAPSQVQTAAFARLEGYPAVAASHGHRTLALVPRSAARILMGHPQMVAEAVHALASRDVVSMRAVERTERFHVVPQDDIVPAHDVVLLPVRMTQHLYAQLSHDRFFPPKAYGERWRHAVEQYRLYLSGTERASRVSEEQATWGRWCDIGAKLTAGLELAWAAKSARAAHAAEKHDAAADEALLASLTALGYFGAAAPHTDRWNELASEARALAAPHGDDASQSLHALRATLEAQPDSVVQQASLPLDVKASRANEDSEAWLAEVPKELDALAEPGANAEDQTLDRLGTFLTKMNEFLHGEGDVEGALFDDDTFEDGDEAEADDDEEADEDNTPRTTEHLVEPVPLSEWGAANTARDTEMRDVPPEPRTAEAAPAPAPAPKPTDRPRSTRLQGFSSKEHYEGDSDSEGSLQGDEHDTHEERTDRRRWLELDEAPEEDDGVDMAQELDGFLDFTRKALGLSDAQYAQILDDRKERGAYVPAHTQPAAPASPPQNSVPNSQLDSFDTVLAAMENELAKEHAKHMRDPEPTDMEEDEELGEEDAELLQQLLATGASIPESLQRFADTSGASSTEIDALANFLESFKAQNGAAGPLSNLAGRLGVGPLPRDADARPS
ncbi:hypothetical protein MBRA1_002998 [Malassezia brasiliensis]|uniref:Uncharacterized protein n=1 Tax=Malassezia brasiliensis TaxID=1821822 RepID=A0AAF0DWT6_9BASI|nr:hypothetical protein MBRA1_002998 [Malassezia brasiliensis]